MGVTTWDITERIDRLRKLDGGTKDFGGPWLGINKPEKLKNQIAVGILETVK